MRLLWIKTDFLHPTTKGGQIRTLEMLRRLHREHEIHYVAFDDPDNPEGRERAQEYATRVYPIGKHIPRKSSLRFGAQLAGSVLSATPLAVSRYRSSAMRRMVEQLRAGHQFDAMICDFLVPAINLTRLDDFVVFEHNVEAALWRRHAAEARGVARRWFFGRQARAMFQFERDVCRRARHVIAVSEADAATIREWFGAERVSAVPTGVDLDYFAPPERAPLGADLAFIGSMDWMPNIHGVQWFVKDVLPLIRARRPDTSVAIVGRSPGSEIQALARIAGGMEVTGTVPDVRPYLWGARVSIVPIHIGGGTRLKIYESMAAGVPVVSTTVGAEGLEIDPPHNIRIANSAAEFAASCLELLEHEEQGAAVSRAARRMVMDRFSWEQVASIFARILEMSQEQHGIAPTPA